MTRHSSSIGWKSSWPIFDVKLELYFENQKITAYRQDVIDLVDAQDSPAQAVLPAATI